MAEARRITATAEDNIYADDIIFARDTRYQHLVLTRFKDDLRLLPQQPSQFSSRDEYRYHEALIHPGLTAVPAPRRVLVLRRRRRPGRSRDPQISPKSKASRSSISIRR